MVVLSLCHGFHRDAARDLGGGAGCRWQALENRTMFHSMKSAVEVLICLVCCLGMLLFSTVPNAHGAGNTVLALDGMIVNNTGGGQPGWGGFGRFSYGGNMIGTPTTPGLGPYDAFTLSHTDDSGSGVGVNLMLGTPAMDSPRDPFLGVISPVTSAMFPLLDRATFGANFDPNQYVAELVYKPLAGNTATQLNMTLDTTDGFTADGLRAGEQWQWGFFNLLNAYNTAQTGGNLDADGFATVRSNTGVLSQAAANFNGQSFLYTTQPLPNNQRDMMADFNDFEGGPLRVPNGVVQIHLQTVYGGAQQTLIDNWEIKELRIVKLNPDPLEVARLDSRSGISLRFGSPFQNTTPIVIGGTEYLPTNTDQLSRFDQNGFTNLVINTADDANIGGFGIWQPAGSTVFDGTDAAMEIRARLTAPLGAGQADSIQVVLKDKDSNGMGDSGGEEYHFDVDLNQFNTTTLTTLSVPLEAAMVEQAQEFATPGDGLRTDFNLYYLGVLTNAGEGLVDLEIEYIRVVLPAPPGVAGDYNNNGTVDAADYALWRNGGPLANESASPGVVDQADYNLWRANFSSTGGGGSGQAVAAVPEPAAWLLSLVSLGALGSCRRGRG
jgi:hypothetical protein